MTTTTQSELTGRRLGVFRLDAPLGKGGMGAVYRGVDTALERDVAIKVLAPGLSGDPEYVERFVREARTAARLNHQNVVQIYGAGFEDGVAYMALELVTGGSLASVLTRVRPFPLRRACEVVRDIARGLAAAHAMGIVHRDLKPDNVLLTPDGVVKLADFGLARVVAGQRITQTGSFMGTPQYCSPEQCNGVEVGFASDLYSLGVVLYELLAGRPPHEAPTPLALFKKILVEETPPISTVRADVPPSLGAVLTRLLQKSPAARYPSAEALAADLDRVIARLPVGAGDPAEPPASALAQSLPSAALTVLETPAGSGAPAPVPPPRRASPFEDSVVGAPPIVVPERAPAGDAGGEQVAAPAAAKAAVAKAGSLGPGPSTSPARPGRRAVLAAAVVGVVVLVAGVLGATGLLAPTERRRANVAVLGWKNGSNTEEFAWLADAIPEFVRSELAGVAAVQVIDPQRAEADYWVQGTFYQQGADVVLRAEVHGPDGIVYSRPARPSPKDAVLGDMSAMAQAVAEALQGREVEVQGPSPLDRVLASRQERRAASFEAQRPSRSGALDAAPAQAPPAPAPPAPQEAKVTGDPARDELQATKPNARPLEPPSAGFRPDAALDDAALDDVAAAEAEADADDLTDGAQVAGRTGRANAERAAARAPKEEGVEAGAGLAQGTPSAPPPSAGASVAEPGPTAAPALLDRLRAAEASGEWSVGVLVTEALRASDDRETLEEAMRVAATCPNTAPLVGALRRKLDGLN